MPENIVQNLFEGLIVFGVIGSIALIYWAKISKKSPGQILKKLMDVKFFNEPPEIINKPMEETQQIWQERRTMM